MSESGQWRNLKLPLAVYDLFKMELVRIARLRGEDPNDLFSDDATVKLRAKIANIEYGVLEVLRNLSDEEIRMLLGKVAK